MFRHDERHDPLLAAIEEIIRTMYPKGLEGTLHRVVDLIDSMAGRLLEVERSLAAAQERSKANATTDVSALVQSARDLLDGAGSILRNLAEAGLPSSSEPPTDPGARPAPDPDKAGPSDREVRDFIDRLTQLLPKPANRPPGESPAADKAMILCKALAYLALGLVILANVVTGPISLAIQEIAKQLRAPLVATGVELSLAAAKEMAGGELDAELTGQLCAETILGFVSPGSRELKATAFLLRLAGTIACLAAGVRPIKLHTQCPCYPDLLSDTGSAAIGS